MGPNAVRQTENQPRNYQLSGVLDFGDINYNFYVFELAIALCYMMIECKCMNALDAPGHVLAGYNRVRAIPEKEFIILKVTSLQSSKVLIISLTLKSYMLLDLTLGLYSRKAESITYYGCIFESAKSGSLRINNSGKRLGLP